MTVDELKSAIKAMLNKAPNPSRIQSWDATQSFKDAVKRAQKLNGKDSAKLQQIHSQLSNFYN